MGKARKAVSDGLEMFSEGFSAGKELATSVKGGATLIKNEIDDWLAEQDKNRKVNKFLNDEERRLDFYKEKKRLNAQFQQFNEPFCKECDDLLNSILAIE